jgi:hypothetical protein
MRGGRSYPELRCQGCAQAISDLRMAGVAWAPTEAWERRSCGRADPVQDESLLDAPEHEHWLWMELDEFLFHLRQSCAR